MQLLETWSTPRLEALGVDGVFAPYIVGMLPPHGGDDNDLEAAKDNIYQVLMGWLAPEDEEYAQKFVDELVAMADNPTQLADAVVAATTLDKRIEDDINTMLAQDEELKATAPTFIPRKLLSPEVAEFVPTRSPETPCRGNLNHFQSASTSCVSPVPSVEKDQGNEVICKDAEDDDSIAMQDEDSFFWSVAFELVSHLQLKFPDMDPHRLCDLLRLVGLDVDKAHAVIKTTLERESIGTGQVCRHYLQGECRRADCMFLHDTDKITCRFWLRGSCLQAEDCVFAHDFCDYYTMDETALGQRDYDSEDEMHQTSALLDIDAEEMFPSLQSVSLKQSASVPSISQERKSLLKASANAYESKEDAVTHFTMNFARAVALQPLPAQPIDSDMRKNGLKMETSRRMTPPSWLHCYKAEKTSDNIQWVSTGQSASKQYLRLREQAYDMACARNKCFMGATQAYRNGNKALAKKLSTEGHEYNIKMKTFHFLAASEIFESRNPPNQLYMDRMMDLHGLHVAEAVELLAKMLPKFADEGVDSIYLVTGSGHHSKGPTGNSRLLPAVEHFLAGEGYHYTPVADGAGFVGMLLVELLW
ncbi:hypothetical protein CCR75_003357 [Bremia lactucae]|uniref:Smr domain-containing protein n=1 Tax=Bremia lactucae TaxID=4779 RepID=A0A976FIF4_BRELC|nr:hypothetical protein CCR75_003357 [Bremia lactucae]